MVMKKEMKISQQDLEQLYKYAEKISRIGKKYGLDSFVNIFINALDQLKPKNKNKKDQMEFGFLSKSHLN